MRIPLRYYDPALQKQLIHSYVSGLMSYRARLRMRGLLQQLPELEAQLLIAEAGFQLLNANLAQDAPSAKSWKQIQLRLGWQVERWWQKINYWRAASATLALSLLMAITVQVYLPVQDTLSEYVPISYVGILNGDDTEASLAAAVHRATDAEDAPWMMTLHLTQPWSESAEPASLWITDSRGRKRTIGQVQSQDTQQFQLTDSQWQFIQDAVWMELTADNNGRVILQGKCLSLKHWQS